MVYQNDMHKNNNIRMDVRMSDNGNQFMDEMRVEQ